MMSINTGILGAIISGIIVFLLHERFSTIRLPDAFAFFGGVRFVPIITTLVLGLAGFDHSTDLAIFCNGDQRIRATNS